jgi:hypothetical protein
MKMAIVHLPDVDQPNLTGRDDGDCLRQVERDVKILAK